jgi:hypothetical protein
MAAPDFENERQIEAALAEAVRAHAPPVGLQERIRERLFARPQVAACPDPQPIAVLAERRGIVGQITRNRRFQVLAGATVGAAVVLGVLLLWDGNAVQSVSAMEKMAENIRKVRSARWGRTVQLLNPPAKATKPGQPPAERQMSFTGYWLASGSRRTESDNLPKWKGPGPQFISISPAGKLGINIDHRRKTFFHSPPFLRPCPTSADWRWEVLGKFSGKADRDLGVKTVEGKKVHGFQIDRKKIHGPEVMPGTMEIWIDTESNLPVLVRDDEELPNDAVCTVVTTDIQYNIDFDPKLFDTTPPQGYTDETKKPTPLDEQVGEIRKALEACSAATDGTYPGTIDELSVAEVFGKWSKRMTKAIRPQSDKGFNEIAAIWEYNPDPMYNGKTVRAKDKDKVLLRWKLDDGRYEVIFGDLRAETVTAERLHGLEGK